MMKIGSGETTKALHVLEHIHQPKTGPKIDLSNFEDWMIIWDEFKIDFIRYIESVIPASYNSSIGRIRKAGMEHFYYPFYKLEELFEKAISEKNKKSIDQIIWFASLRGLKLDNALLQKNPEMHGADISEIKCNAYLEQYNQEYVKKKLEKSISDNNFLEASRLYTLLEEEEYSPFEEQIKNCFVKVLSGCDKIDDLVFSDYLRLCEFSMRFRDPLFIKKIIEVYEKKIQKKNSNLVFELWCYGSAGIAQKVLPLLPIVKSELERIDFGRKYLLSSEEVLDKLKKGDAAFLEEYSKMEDSKLIHEKILIKLNYDLDFFRKLIALESYESVYFLSAIYAPESNGDSAVLYLGKFIGDNFENPKELFLMLFRGCIEFLKVDKGKSPYARRNFVFEILYRLYSIDDVPADISAEAKKIVRERNISNFSESDNKALDSLEVKSRK